jgi:putative transposase
VIEGVNRKCYIHMIKQEAIDAEKTGRSIVIVQDNGSIHQCREVQKLWSKWDSMGLYINSQNVSPRSKSKRGEARES